MEKYSIFYFCLWVVMWLQYSASRGVYGTPTFYVNGFVLSDAGSPLDFGGWRKVIDPLVQTHKVEKQDDLLSFF